MKEPLPLAWRLWTFVLLAVCAYGPVLVGLCILCWQGYSWLKEGTWTAFSILDLLLFAGFQPDWAVAPNSWYGLWSLFNWLPGSVALIAVGASTLRLHRQDVREGRYD